jgi:hypothetical protein
MAIMDDEQRARHEMHKRVINLFNANPDWLRRTPALIAPLIDLIESVATVEGIEASAPKLENDIRDADMEVLASAEALHATIAPYRAQLSALGLDADFVRRLEEYIDELRKSVPVAGAES